MSSTEDDESTAGSHRGGTGHPGRGAHRGRGGHRGGGAHRGRVAQRAPAALLLLVLLLASVAGFLSRGTAAPLPADAPAELFSAERAATAAAPLVQEPRPAGTEANAAAHDHLAAELTAAGFTVESAEGLGLRSQDGRAAAGYVRNLVATRPGSDPTGTLVLATHLDSVPHAPGAADAGVGLAVILETVRALGPEALRNDLVVLVVDGEERGLLGAQDIVHDPRGQLREPVVVINHEARGTTGRPLVARTAGPMHEVLPAMPRPEYESFTDALFAVIPNDTDFTVYREEAGWWGLDVALIGGSWAYHSPQDDPAHLDAGSLQHFGDLTLALTRELGARDLGALGDGSSSAPVQTTMPWGILALPRWLVPALGVAAALGLAAAVPVLRRRGLLSLRGTALGALLTAVALPLAAGAGYGLWLATATAFPGILSQTTREPVVAGPFLAADLLAGTTVLAAAWVLGRLLVGRAALLVGAGLLSLALMAAIAVASPDFASSMVVPSAAAGLGAVAGVLLPPTASVVVRALALLPTGWLLGTQLQALGEFGIASSAGALSATAALALAAAAPLLIAPRAADPSALPSRRRRRLLAPVLPAVLALALALGGTWLTRASGEPVQERVLARVDAATGATSWDADGVTEWGRSLDGTRGTSAIDAPQVRVEEAEGGAVRILLTSPRAGAEYELSLAEGGFAAASVDGEPVGGSLPLTTLAILGVPAGQEVVLEVRVPEGARLDVIETAYAPELADGWSPPGEEVSLVQPRVEIVHESLTVDDILTSR